MRFPWQHRKIVKASKAETEQAKTDYEWAVQNRTTVDSMVKRLIYHGEQNHLIENLNRVAKGGHK